MLEKTDIPLIPDGYPLVVAMNALMDAVKSVSQVINNKKKAVSVELKEVMLKSSWSGVMAALALLLDTWWVGMSIGACIAVFSEIIHHIKAFKLEIKGNCSL